MWLSKSSIKYCNKINFSKKSEKGYYYTAESGSEMSE